MAVFNVRRGSEEPLATAARLGPRDGVAASGFFVTDEIRSSEQPKPHVNRIWCTERGQAELICDVLNGMAVRGVIKAQEPWPQAVFDQINALQHQILVTRSLLPWNRAKGDATHR